MRALLVSTYEMGRQPFGLASPAAWLRRDGVDVRCVDLSRDGLDDQDIAGAGLVAFHLPMHTAARLAGPVIERVRRVNPSARIAAYGLYAPINAGWLRALGVHEVLGAEFEEQLAALAAGRAPRPETALPKLHFLTPDRSGLPALQRYAALHAGGERRVTGYTEASRGCRHRCRHCPIVPVYDGQFRIVQAEVVLADIAAQAAAGAEHITFGDPDFFNGPGHALRIAEAVHTAHPRVTYDVTIKVEHLLAHRDLLPRLRATGCAFVTTAVESLDDRVLALLEKGHTRADFFRVVELCRAAELPLAPTFVAFHPWQTLAGYCELLDAIESLDLVGHVAPIQLAIRLLVPQGSRLLALDDVRARIGRFNPRTLTYPWRHADPAVDRLFDDVSALVGRRLTADRHALFEEIAAVAHARAGRPRPNPRPARNRATVPFLNEPWYC
jgi:radical SAM superfamily enzyme YgiQ (UPF0313 family)